MTGEFELTMQDPPRMNEQLDSVTDLIGETIRAVFDSNLKGAGMLFVTENGNWLALEAEPEGCGEEAYIVEVRNRPLADFFHSGLDMLKAGLINSAQVEEIEKKKQEQTAAKQIARAAQLRLQAASIERLFGKTA